MRYVVVTSNYLHIDCTRIQYYMKDVYRRSTILYHLEFGILNINLFIHRLIY